MKYSGIDIKSGIELALVNTENDINGLIDRKRKRRGTEDYVTEKLKSEISFINSFNIITGGNMDQYIM